MNRRSPAPDGPWPWLPILALVVALFALPARAAILETADPFNDDAPVTANGMDDGPDPFGAYIVHGTIRNRWCDSDTVGIVTTNGSTLARDRTLLEALAECTFTQIDYTYRTRDEFQSAMIELEIDRALGSTFLMSACDDLVECSGKVADTCRLYGKPAPRFVSLVPYNQPGYEKDKCTGTCGDNSMVVNVTCRIVKPKIPPRDVAK